MMTNHPYQLMLSDVDGTLLRTDKQLSEANIAAVQRLRDAGINFTLVSSRPPRAMRWLIDALDITLPVAAFNGGTLLQPDGSLLETHRLERKVVETVFQRLKGEELDIWVFADDQWLIDNPDNDYNGHEEKALGYGPVLVERFDEYLDRVDKLVAVSKNHNRLTVLQQELDTALGEQAHTVRSQPYYLDITAPQASKGHALIALAERLGVPLERTVAIGDGENDISMLQKAGLSIAMGQAEDAVKSHAMHTTAETNKDGLAEAIDTWVLATT
jgi:Cof subfamily protein (haloacid dehalogenase superfamily)